MKTRRVNRYYCDFCKKSGGSAHHMQTHELHCTMNPNRICRMCDQLGELNTLSELIAFLPNPEDFKKPSGITESISNGYVITGLDEATKIAIEKIYKIAECPMCIFSALRQTHLTSYIDNSIFILKDELKKTWSKINDETNQYY